MCSILKAKKILVGVSGGIAAYKIPSFIRLLKQSGAEVQVIATKSAFDFVTPLTLSTVSSNPVLSDSFNAKTGHWTNHVELGEWADLFILAPLTSNTLADLVSAKSDNLLLLTYLSARCPVIVSPAMDLEMWIHPAVQRNIEQLAKDGVHVIPPQMGFLASGLYGLGRMPEPEYLLNAICNQLNNKPLKGKHFLITAGPTFEPIDPVRFIGNRSSGKMGLALAEAATNLGAKVTLVHGPIAIKPNPFIHKIIPVNTADEMLQACLNVFSSADIIIKAAAVADFKPRNQNSEKIKKTENDLMMILDKTPDILAELGKLKNSHQKLIGFALETNDALTNARKKLFAKNADLIILNSLLDEGAGFNYDTNKVTLVWPNHEVELSLAPKYEIAEKIVTCFS